MPTKPTRCARLIASLLACRPKIVVHCTTAQWIRRNRARKRPGMLNNPIKPGRLPMKSRAISLLALNLLAFIGKPISWPLWEMPKTLTNPTICDRPQPGLLSCRPVVPPIARTLTLPTPFGNTAINPASMFRGVPNYVDHPNSSRY
jgi:hypothetical protein